MPFSGPVATFRSAGGEPASAFDPRIGWGDGAITDGTVVAVSCPPGTVGGGACYRVDGTHTYTSPGTYTVAISVRGPGGGPSATTTATVAAPPAEPPPPPPSPPADPPAAPAPVAALVPSAVSAPAGTALVLDASPSTGAVHTFAFDLDGNGTHETTCDSSKAVVIYGKPGPVDAGVQVTGAGGSSTAKVALNVTGPTGGPKADPTMPDVLGACGAGGMTTEPGGSSGKVLACATTMKVGLAELTLPTSQQSPACFTPKNIKNLVLKPPKTLGSGNLVTHWVATKGREVIVNGLLLPPAAQAHIAVKPDQKIVGAITADFQQAGQAHVALFRSPGPVALSSSPVKTVWSVAKPGVVQTIPKFGGQFLGLTAAPAGTPLKLGDGRFDLAATLDFPLKTLDQILDKVGLTSAPIPLTTTSDAGLATFSATAKFPDIPLGFLTLRDVAISYADEGGKSVWQGGLTADVVGGAKLGGTVRFVNGNLDGASAHGTFPGMGVPVGCCVYLRSLSGAWKTSEISGGAQFVVPPQIWGDTFLLAANTSVTFRWQDPMSIKAKGTFYIVGVPLAQASAEIGTWGGSFKGSMSEDFGPFSVSMQAQAMIVVKQGWMASAGGNGCFDWIGACIGIGAAVSNNGVAACGVAGWFPIGGFYRWSTQSAGIFFACGWGVLYDKAGVPKALQSQAGARQVRVRPGDGPMLLRLRGVRGRPPAVTVVDPRGRRYAPPADGRPGGDRTTHVWLTDLATGERALAVRRPVAGTWRILPEAGGGPLRSVQRMAPLPRRPARVRITGGGRRRALRYTIDRAVDGRVVFFERSRGEGGPGQRIGVARGRPACCGSPPPRAAAAGATSSRSSRRRTGCRGAR